MPSWTAVIRLGCVPLLLRLAGSPIAVWSQTPDAKPQFEVASVKLVKQPVPPHSVSLIINHGRLTVEAAQLRQIIGLAYGIQRVMVRGCPAWCDEDMFDIVATTGNADATRDEIRVMLQELLEERFKLAAHRETKAVSGFELIVAKNGPKLPPTKDESGPSNVAPHDGGLEFHNAGLGGLVNWLANVLGEPVRDATGLSGRYDFKLVLRRDESPSSGGASAVPQPRDVSGVVVASLQELGLKLQPHRTPAEVLIIDHAEHPTEN